MIADRGGLTAYQYTRKNVTEALSMTSSGAGEKQAAGKNKGDGQQRNQTLNRTHRGGTP
jgi:hypothetical protein